MKKQKLSLENIKVKSFITRFQNHDVKTIKGGGGTIVSFRDFMCGDDEEEDDDEQKKQAFTPDFITPN